MQQQLKVTLIQSDLIWENPKQNRINFEKRIASISENVDLIVLPEMFTTGFTMNAESVAETMQGETIKWMKQMAFNYDTAIVGSIVISENQKFYNRLLFTYPSGEVNYYDKRHTFTLAGEDMVYASGNERVIIDYKGWKICPLVCYDLRFPVWARNTDNYDVLLYVANWPKPRVLAWEALLKARAIENMSYCVGVNRVGVDGLNIEYSGHSAVYNVLGQEMSAIKQNKEQAETVILQKQHIKKYRSTLKFLDDRDEFTLKES
ncbi:amidohydrolase [Seonamhaeicola aphaedonensis]|uniref:Omega-amidase YafV n=1 Tax=Seonamhaeicola aphaedonensis TaxID=1461338 RepID=A0A3D9HM90_9FLAO|nr:amidohydrolase [Seonamhaeicola aphaedonensis]RED50622.1 putative amidohydrolase [Seonamhaeicola aphaedonensis]